MDGSALLLRLFLWIPLIRHNNVSPAYLQVSLNHKR